MVNLTYLSNITETPLEDMSKWGTEDLSTEQLIISTFKYAQWFQWISVPPYILVIASILFGGGKLNSSFFHLVLANTVADFSGIITGCMPEIWPGFPMYRSIFESFRGLSIHGASLGLLTLGANRYLAIAYPLRYVLWTKAVTIKVIMIQYALAIMISFFRVLPCCQIKNEIPLAFVNGELTELVFKMQLVVNTAIVVVMSFMYGGTLYALNKHGGPNVTNRVAVRLFVIAFVSALPFVVANMAYVLRAFTSLVFPYPTVFFVHGNALFTSITPWLLLALSKQVQKSALVILTCGKAKKANVITVTGTKNM